MEEERIPIPGKGPVFAEDWLRSTEDLVWDSSLRCAAKCWKPQMSSAGRSGLVAEDCKRSKEENCTALDHRLRRVVVVVLEGRCSSIPVALSQVY